MGCQYIPSVEYFAHWAYHGIITIEANEHYPKRTWRNKTAILGHRSPQYLSVPLRKGKNQQLPIREVAIAYDENWHRVHYNSIQSAYGKTGYFIEFREEIRQIYDSRYQKLWDLNMAFIDLIILLLGDTLKYQLTSDYIVEQGVLDFRNGIPAGESLLPKDKVPVYPQVQRIAMEHMSNLSILDVLSHLGPEAKTYLQQYSKQLYPAC
jgi:hypothetical protein